MRRLMILAGLALAGCATDHVQPVKVVETKVPVPVPCVSDKTPGPQSYPDTPDALAKADPAGKVRIWRAANLLMHQRLAEIEPVLAACRKLP